MHRFSEAIFQIDVQASTSFDNTIVRPCDTCRRHFYNVWTQPKPVYQSTSFRLPLFGKYFCGSDHLYNAHHILQFTPFQMYWKENADTVVGRKSSLLEPFEQRSLCAILRNCQNFFVICYASPALIALEYQGILDWELFKKLVDT